MDNTAPRGRVVVGIDGSEGARAALSWAADEARRRGAVLHVVHAYSYPAFPVSFGSYPDLVDPRVVEEAAEELTSKEVASVLDPEQGRGVLLDTQSGPAAAVLVDASKGADMLVVGSRGRGGFAGLLLGSVSQQCAHHATVPVVIVPDPAQLTGRT